MALVCNKELFIKEQVPHIKIKMFADNQCNVDFLPDFEDDNNFPALPF